MAWELLKGWGKLTVGLKGMKLLLIHQSEYSKRHAWYDVFDINSDYSICSRYKSRVMGLSVTPESLFLGPYETHLKFFVWKKMLGSIKPGNKNFKQLLLDTTIHVNLNTWYGLRFVDTRPSHPYVLFEYPFPDLVPLITSTLLGRLQHTKTSNTIVFF